MKQKKVANVNLSRIEPFLANQSIMEKRAKKHKRTFPNASQVLAFWNHGHKLFPQCFQPLELHPLVRRVTLKSEANPSCVHLPLAPRYQTTWDTARPPPLPSLRRPRRPPAPQLCRGTLRRQHHARP